jgi:hypothetical protein
MNALDITFPGVCKITAPQLPGATFFGHAALREYASERLRYEQACQEFECGRWDAGALADELTTFGYDAAEITAHVTRPGYRHEEAFG